MKRSKAILKVTAFLAVALIISGCYGGVSEIVLGKLMGTEDGRWHGELNTDAIEVRFDESAMDSLILKQHTEYLERRGFAVSHAAGYIRTDTTDTSIGEVVLQSWLEETDDGHSLIVTGFFSEEVSAEWQRIERSGLKEGLDEYAWFKNRLLQPQYDKGKLYPADIEDFNPPSKLDSRFASASPG